MIYTGKPAFLPYLRYYISLLIWVALTSCAIIGGGPSGGKKDIKPPIVKNVDPPNKSVNFNASKIAITFDEFVDLDNVYKEVIVSPTLPKLPEIFVNRKTLTINLKNTTLQPNTTYSIQFGNAITDINEKNVLRNYRYVFSTGSYLDSLFIKGRVVEALSHKLAVGYKIELYKEGNDSGIYKKKPLYYARTDSFGKFNINYLPKGGFLLYALNDKNDNYFVDEGEDVGFPPGVLKVDSSMIIADSIPAFPYVPTQFYVKKAQLSNHSLQVKFNHFIDSVNVFVNKKKFFTVFEKHNEIKDSFIWWMSEDFPEMEVSAYYNSTHLDTVIKRSEKTTPLKFSFEVSSSIDNSNYYELPILLKANKPVDNINLAKVLFYKDTSMVKDLKYKNIDDNRTVLALLYNYEDGKNYKFKFLPGAVSSIFGDKNKDTIQANLIIPGLKNYGYFEITTITDEGNYIFQLVNESGTVTFYKNVSRETLVKIPFVNPGKYKARLIKDENKNGRWDGGDIKTRREPEVVFYYPGTFNIKANWELVGTKFDLTKKEKPAPPKKR